MCPLQDTASKKSRYAELLKTNERNESKLSFNHTHLCQETVCLKWKSVCTFKLIQWSNQLTVSLNLWVMCQTLNICILVGKTNASVDLAKNTTYFTSSRFALWFIKVLRQLDELCYQKDKTSVWHHESWSVLQTWVVIVVTINKYFNIFHAENKIPLKSTDPELICCLRR